MPTENAWVVRSHSFLHKNQSYDVIAFVEPNSPKEYKVEVVSDGEVVIITYRDGFRARLAYSVTSEIYLNLTMDKGLNAVVMLMETAEMDIKRLI